MTPIFSFLLSCLMFAVSASPGAAMINTYGAFVFGIAAIDGLFMGLKYFLLETSASVGSPACVIPLTPAHSPAALTQVLVEDAGDTRALLTMRQFVIVVAMMGVGLLWAIV